MNKTKVLIVEDHPLVREMLSELVQSQPEMALVGEVASAEAGLALLDAIAPELALVNLSLPGMDGAPNWLRRCSSAAQTSSASW